MKEEWFDLINVQGEVIGFAPRSVCHKHPGLIHHAVHVLVFSQDGRLFLQKRSAAKDVQPNRWDTSVGGHPNAGESAEKAAVREMREELGVTPKLLKFAYSYFWQSQIETEKITTFATVHEGPFSLDPREISEGRFWTIAEISSQLDYEIFTPQFTQEFSRMLEWWKSNWTANSSVM
ncbi:MAG TPA: NUDIX domain-containing protein [Kiritimatiellia bacterium]|nr:NUDIX domain-containing protein [Kiritimatiellia bacterium]